MATTETQREAVGIVLKEFFVLTEEGWINTRADREISIMREKQQKQRDKANRRWHKPESEHGNTNTEGAALPQHQEIDATAYATASEKDANAMPPTPTPTPTPINIKEAIASLSSATDDLPGKVLELKKTELPCPHQKIIELYGKHLPNLAQPRSWDGQRQAALRQRWHLCAKKSAFSDGYADEAGGLAFWDSFFSYIARDTKLATGYESNGRTWVPDLPWILNSTNFQKIVDGKYDIQKVAASR